MENDDNYEPVRKTGSVDIEDVREFVETLTASEKVDKESALQITRLFHTMELIHNREINVRDAQIAKMESDLTQQRLQTELDRLATRHIHEKNELLETPRKARR